jgi:hypothetical protein
MTHMPFEDLEQAYEFLARAIDAAGPDREALFLTKLALTLAHQVGDLDMFKNCIQIALEEMPNPTPIVGA